MQDVLSVLLVLTFSVGSVFFVFRTYLNIRRFTYLGFFHHYRICVPAAAALISVGVTLLLAVAQLWHAAVVLVLVGVLIIGWEMCWRARAWLALVSAKRGLATQRRRFTSHTDADRELFRRSGGTVESAEWAYRAKRYRDAHSLAGRVLSILQAYASGLRPFANHRDK
jgi:hypothetical protein